VRVASTACTCWDVPWATSPIAPAISETARPASSDVVAISSEAALTADAESETWAIIALSEPRVWS
jgi:hypothetical protein